MISCIVFSRDSYSHRGGLGPGSLSPSQLTTPNDNLEVSLPRLPPRIASPMPLSNTAKSPKRGPPLPPRQGTESKPQPPSLPPRPSRSSTASNLDKPSLPPAGLIKDVGGAEKQMQVQASEVEPATFEPEIKQAVPASSMNEPTFSLTPPTPDKANLPSIHPKSDESMVSDEPSEAVIEYPTNLNMVEDIKEPVSLDTVNHVDSDGTLLIGSAPPSSIDENTASLAKNQQIDIYEHSNPRPSMTTIVSKPIANRSIESEGSVDSKIRESSESKTEGAESQ